MSQEAVKGVEAIAKRDESRVRSVPVSRFHTPK